MGKKPQRVRTLDCCCCGGFTIGRQWWNQDTGFGLCAKCVTLCRRGMASDEEMRLTYGTRGEHYDLGWDDLRQAKRAGQIDQWDFETIAQSQPR